MTQLPLKERENFLCVTVQAKSDVSFQKKIQTASHQGDLVEMSMDGCPVSVENLRKLTHKPLLVKVATVEQALIAMEQGGDLIDLPMETPKEAIQKLLKMRKEIRQLSAITSDDDEGETCMARQDERLNREQGSTEQRRPAGSFLPAPDRTKHRAEIVSGFADSRTSIHAEGSKAFSALASRNKIGNFRNAPIMILSYHDYHGTPSLSVLWKIFQEARRKGADIVKIVTTAKKTEDNLIIFNLLATVRKQSKTPCIAHCMGEKGVPSRKRAADSGSFITYVAVDKASITAKGMMTLKEWKNTVLKKKNGA